MEYWHFSKKELDLIADLMLQVLLTKPDKSELSAMNLFGEAIRSEEVEGQRCISCSWHTYFGFQAKDWQISPSVDKMGFQKCHLES